MPVSVQCGFCNKKYRVRDELAGKTLTCKGCGGQIRIPDHDRDVLEVVELPDDDEAGDIPVRSSDDWEASFGGQKPRSRGAMPPRRTARGRPARSKRAPVFVWVLVAAGGAAAGIAVLVTQWIAGNRHQPPPPQIARHDPGLLPNNLPPGFPNPAFPGRGGQPNPALPGAQPAPRGLVRPPAEPAPKQQAQPAPGAANGSSKPKEAPAGLQRSTLPGVAVEVEPWIVAVDPPPAIEGETAPDRKIRLVFPRNSSNGEVLYPECPSPMVALGSNNNERESRDVRDLRTNRRLGSMKGLRLSGGRFALSPDGKYIAAWIFTQKALYVWDVKAEKPLGELPFDAGGFLKFLAFAGTSRLVACGNDGVLHVWSMPAGAGERTIELPKFLKEQSLALSPGGKYLVLMDGDFSKSVIRAYDLASGKMAGEILVALKDVSVHGCRAVEFSLDGTELAALFEKGGRDTLLAVYNVDSGELLDEFEFSDELRGKFRSAGGRDRLLEWFPNKKRWLVYGLGLLDREARQVVWSMPDVERPGAGRFSLARKPFDDDHVLVVDAEKNEVVLLGYELPKEEIARSTSVVAAGGLRVDASLPPLTPHNLQGATPLAAEGGAPAWQAAPDPLDGHDRATLERSLVLPGRTGTLRGAMLTGPAAGRAVLLYLANGGAGPPPGAGPPASKGRGSRPPGSAAPAWLSVVDLAAGKEAAMVPLPYAGDLLSVSVDGTRACARLADGESRLDLFSLETGEHLSGLRPYQSEKENEQKVKAAVLIDNDLLLTLSAADKLVLWKLPACQAVYTLDKAQKPSVSPNRRYLAVANGRAVRLFDAATGRAAGDLPLRGLLQAAAFHPNGQRLATISSDSTGYQLTDWNLSTGQPDVQFPLPTGAQIVHWCGEKHVLIDNALLVDLPHKMVVWNYALAGGVHITDSPDARHWYLAGGAGNAPVSLVAAALPDAAALKTLADATLKPDYVIQPGSKVSLRVNLASTPPGRADFQREVQQALTANLQTNRVSVADGQSVVVVASMAHRSTGKSNEYDVTQFGGRAGFNKQTIKVAEQVVECAVQVYRNNALMWESKLPFSNSAFIFHVQKGKSAEQHLNEQMWNGAAGFLLNFALPQYVLPADAVKGLGNSILTADGPARG